MRVTAAAAGRSTALASTRAALPLPLSSSTSTSSLMQRRRQAASPLRASASPPTSPPAPSSDLSDAALEERSKIQKMLDRLVVKGRERGERVELETNDARKKPCFFFFFFSRAAAGAFFFSTVEKKTLVVTYLPTSPNLFPRRFSLSDSFLTAHARTPRSIAKLIEKTKNKKNQTRKKNKNKKTHTLSRPYAAGFTTDIESDTFAKGLDEDVVRAISAKKDEPEWLLDFRLRAFRKWLTMPEPDWSDNSYPQIDFQDYSYYSAPKEKPKKASLDEVDPDLLATFDRLGIPLGEQKRLANVAVDAVFDSVSIATTFKKELADQGIVFMSLSEAVKEHPELVKKHLGSVVPAADNYYAALNSAVFSDGSFVYVPKGIRSPMEISTYFRINAAETGQFERTLIVCEDDAYVSYLEGCTAPAYDKNQLHAAVVELSAGARAEIKYSTVQNWFAGDAETGKGGIYNFVTKRGLCAGEGSKISWTQVETGSAITWKYPSVVLAGKRSFFFLGFWSLVFLFWGREGG